MGDKNSSGQSDRLDQEGAGLGPEGGELIRRYLLSELTKQEQEEVEERLMSDDEYYKQVLEAEDELVDEYVSGELTGREQERFEYSFLSTSEGRKEVNFSKALREYASKTKVAEEPQSRGMGDERVSWWDSLVGLLRPGGSVVRWSLAAAAVLLLVGSAGLVIEVQRLQNELGQLQAKQTALEGNEEELQQQIIEERARNDQLAEELQLQQEQRASLEQEVVLTPGLVREAGKTKRLNIPPGKKQVGLRLVLAEDSYKYYRAALEADGGKQIWSGDKLEAKRVGSGKSVMLSLPTSILSKGDYRIKLSGVSAGGESEGVGTYYFRVVER